MLLHGGHAGVEVTDSEIRAPHDTVPRFVAAEAMYNVGSGNWSDPAIWSTSTVPGADDQVRILHGTRVTYDLASSVELDAVEVLGRLEFATDRDTSLYLNELTVLPGAALVIGTEQQPVLPQFTAELVFTDTPDELGRHFKTGTVAQPGVDPFQYGNGLLVFDGEVTMHGAPLSETFVRLAVEPRAGDQALTLEQPVSGWKAGDRLVIPDTRQINPVDQPGYHDYEPQWEEVTIAAIDGPRVMLQEVLEFDHLGARDADGTPTRLADGTAFLPHVANLTRNVVLRSENPDGVRGHTQFFHRTAQDIRYVEFRDLGRTEAAAIDNSRRDAEGRIIHIGTNQVGRYSSHNHHLWGPVGGLAAPPGQARESYQLIEVGNSFTGGLKWATALHGTHYGLLLDNVYYNIDGSAVATEDGSESHNEFRHNFVVRTNGGGGEFNGMGEANEDQGDQGDAFWFAGPLNIVQDNVAANIYRNGFVVFPDNIPDSRDSSLYQDVFVPKFPGADLSDPDQRDLVNVRTVGQQDFAGNEVYGATTAAVQFWTIGDRVNFPDTATPNRVEEMRVWHVTGIGIRFYYSAAYEIDGWVHRGDPRMIGASVSEGGPLNPATGAAMTHAGAWAAYSDVRRADIQGMEIGYLNRGRGVADEIVLRDSYLDNLINIAIWKFSQRPIDGSRDFQVQDVIFGDHLNPGANNTFVTSGSAPNPPELIVPESVTVSGFNGVPGQDFRIYYEEQAPDFVMPAGSCQAETGVTNQQCWDAYGQTTAGELAPSRLLDGDDGQLGALRARALGISGLVYETPGTRLQPPRLYVNFEQQGDVKLAYYAVTGNSQQVAGVALRVGDELFESTDLIGAIDISQIRNGTYPVVATLRDAAGQETGQGAQFEVRLPVKDRSQFRRANQPPVLEPLADQQVRANTTLAFSIIAEDPEGDALIYSASPLPAGATLDAATGLFRWTPGNQQVGRYELQLVASDGQQSSTRPLNIEVLFDSTVDGGRVGDWDFNNSSGSLLTDRSAYGNHAEIHGGATFAADGLVLDGVDDFVQMPDSTALKPVQELTVSVRFETSGQNYFKPLVAYDGGSVSSFAIMVFDNGFANRFGDVGQGFWIQWNTRTHGPQSLFVPFAEWEGEVDVTLTFANTSTSGQLRVYVNGQEVAAELDAGQDINYTPWRSQRVQLGMSSAGNWSGRIAAAKMFGRALDAAEVAGLFGNRPPVLEAVDPLVTPANQPLTIPLRATDPEGAAVTYYASGLPAGATLDPLSGQLTWTPGRSQVGEHTIEVGASDGTAGSTRQVLISVTNDLLGAWNADRVSPDGRWLDASGQGHLGTVHGGAAAQDGALVLDGSDDFVQLDRSTALEPASELTVAVRFETSGTNFFTPLVAYDGGSVPSFGIRVLDRSRSSLFGETGQGFYVQIHTQTKGSVALYVPHNAWDQPLDVALTFRNTETSGELRFYINGVLMASNLDAGQTIRYTDWGSKTVQFGKSAAGFWQGKLYQAQLYSRALSSGEISQLF
ncbi:MAG: putative Ig domain-containing protein [Pirellulaceae bacterium]|nr:putative Ig domain-containing protein [Pirellulaceae bacterium]